MQNNSIYTKINSLPEQLKKEANDFIDFLITKEKTFPKDRSEKAKKTRKAGFLKGKIEISPDFDEPLNDFKEYM
jgi:hypothetical protein